VLPWFKLIWADSGYNAQQVNTTVAKIPSLRIEIVKRSDDMKGFVLVPRSPSSFLHQSSRNQANRTIVVF